MTPPLKSYIVRAKRTALEEYVVRASSEKEARFVVESGGGLQTHLDTIDIEVESVEENE